ncbi:MAG: MBL fold metallo-hydrolase [Candidatus Methanoplasma sp.]|jgi:glyoxylase-like metal-dependent hydrolase (beta-lactamase superfamily II)|nr:MBL fold metallo-hydrolase [Candidatus Methanoplasma sp.]
MIKLDVLVIGDFSLDADGGVTGAYSTSTLVRTGDMNIVVDASAPSMVPAIAKSFKQIGIYPDEVDAVILTHAHADHIGNLSLYPNAEVYVHEAEEADSLKAKRICGDMKMCEGVRIVRTPGHTMGSVSVFVESDKRYAIAGDAVPRRRNFDDMIPPSICCDRAAALKSIKEISRYADVIVPGHDPPFATR